MKPLFLNHIIELKRCEFDVSQSIFTKKAYCVNKKNEE